MKREYYVELLSNKNEFTDEVAEKVMNKLMNMTVSRRVF